MLRILLLLFFYFCGFFVFHTYAAPPSKFDKVKVEKKISKKYLHSYTYKKPEKSQPSTLSPSLFPLDPPLNLKATLAVLTSPKSENLRFPEDISNLIIQPFLASIPIETQIPITKFPIISFLPKTKKSDLSPIELIPYDIFRLVINYLPSDDLQSLLMTNKNLQNRWKEIWEVSIINHPIRLSFAKIIADKCPNLRKIVLENANKNAFESSEITSHSLPFYSIISSLADNKMPFLKYINLKGNAIFNESYHGKPLFHSLCSAIKNYYLKSLIHLNISSNTLTDLMMCELFEVMKDGQLKELKHLELEYFSSENNHELHKLAELIESDSLKNLKDLILIVDMNTTNQSNSSLPQMELFDALTHVEIVSLKLQLTQIQHDVIQKFAKHIRDGLFPHLKHLDLAENNLIDKDIFEIASALKVKSSNLPQIRLLDLSCNNLSCEGIKAISSLMHFPTFSQLEYLELTSNNSKSNGFLALNASLRQINFQNLKTLFLSHNSMTDDELNSLFLILREKYPLIENIGITCEGNCSRALDALTVSLQSKKFIHLKRVIITLDCIENRKALINVAETIKTNHLPHLHVFYIFSKNPLFENKIIVPLDVKNAFIQAITSHSLPQLQDFLFPEDFKIDIDTFEQVIEAIERGILRNFKFFSLIPDFEISKNTSKKILNHIDHNKKVTFLYSRFLKCLDKGLMPNLVRIIINAESFRNHNLENLCKIVLTNKNVKILEIKVLNNKNRFKKNFKKYAKNLKQHGFPFIFPNIL